MEIERKFLVDTSKWEKVKPQSGTKIIQGYIMKTPKTTVRVRVRGGQGFITIKGETKGISRTEFEYSIPKQEAEELLNEFCAKKIIKTRYEVEFDGLIWEVDEFESPKAGLILAEVELLDENQSFLHPNWLGVEVSGRSEYYNSNMV